MGGLAALVAKLAAALQMAQGATAAVVIIASATTTTILVTNSNFTQSALEVSRPSATAARASPAPGADLEVRLAADASQCVTTTNDAAKSSAEVARVRNSTDAALRDAEQAAQKQLRELKKAARDADGRRLNELVSGASTKLKSRLTTALNDTAARTLGREGQQDGASSGAPSCTVAAADVTVSLAAVLAGAKGDFATIVADATSAASAMSGTPSNGGSTGDNDQSKDKDKAKTPKP